MKTIWKYPVPLKERFSLTMPVGSHVLTVQRQFGDTCMWVALESEAPVTEVHHFAVVGTGHLLPDEPKRYIGTFQIQGGALVLHLFELYPAPTDDPDRAGEGIKVVNYGGPTGWPEEVAS